MRLAVAHGPAGVSVRSAEPLDAAAVEALYRELVGGEAPVRVRPERIDHILADPHSILAVAELEGRVIGSVFVTICLDPMFGEQPYLVLENLVVADAARGRGVGGALLDAIHAVASTCSASKIMALSSIGRSRAHRFLRLHGYDADAKVGFVRYRSAGRAGA